MNKKAEISYMLMFGNFILLNLIILIAIAAAVTIYFGSGYDMREIDAIELNYAIRECIKSQNLNWSDSQENLFKEILKKCNINKNAISGKKQFKIIKNGETMINYHLNEVQCSYTDNKNFARCKKGFVTIEYEQFEIITGSNEKEKEELA